MTANLTLYNLHVAAPRCMSSFISSYFTSVFTEVTSSFDGPIASMALNLFGGAASRAKLHHFPRLSDGFHAYPPDRVILFIFIE